MTTKSGHRVTLLTLNTDGSGTGVIHFRKPGWNADFAISWYPDGRHFVDGTSPWDLRLNLPRRVG